MFIVADDGWKYLSSGHLHAASRRDRESGRHRLVVSPAGGSRRRLTPGAAERRRRCGWRSGGAPGRGVRRLAQGERQTGTTPTTTTPEFHSRDVDLLNHLLELEHITVGGIHGRDPAADAGGTDGRPAVPDPGAVARRRASGLVREAGGVAIKAREGYDLGHPAQRRRRAAAAARARGRPDRRLPAGDPEGFHGIDAGRARGRARQRRPAHLGAALSARAASRFRPRWSPATSRSGGDAPASESSADAA